MKLNFIKVIIASTLLLVLVGCKKEILREEIKTKQVNPQLVYHTPSTPAEVQLVENLGKITEVLKELYKDKSNLKVVNASIFAKAYTDQSVLLKDLIFPDVSRLLTNKSFKNYTEKWNISLRKFANNFWAEVNKKDDASFKTFLAGLNRSSATQRSSEYTYSDGVSIYYPYNDVVDFEVQVDGGGGYYEPITSLVTATADADEGWGYQPYYDASGNVQYVQVLVNDDYAYQNPTQIIGVNGIEAYDAGIEEISAAFPPEGPIDLPNLPREVKQVYVGDVRCKKQYDSFISFTGNGGGSEIRFTRADGFLQIADGQVQANVYFTPDKTISRSDVRKERWVDFSFEWDGDWELTNLQQNVAIYEEDNRNSSTFNASLTTTVTQPAANGNPGVAVAGTIGFTINFKSDDALIRQSNYNRDVFFILNRTNLEGEMVNGWPVRDKNSPVSFTLNDRTYY